MFDFHMHTSVSYDSKAVPEEMVQRAIQMGLREICFTDHLDYGITPGIEKLTFDTEHYNRAYDHLQDKGIKIRRGFEFGMLPDNQETLRKDISRRKFDFVLGSVHFVDEMDVYFPAYWENRTVKQAEQRYFEVLLECVKAHDDFDVLGHITYIGKVRNNPGLREIPYKDYQDILDEILKTVAQKGKGIEVNTSGFDRCGAYLPTAEYLRRFKELGGQIVTVGSDAHAVDRVGQYCHDACKVVADVFGHVCTFENRKPIFHKL